MDLDSACSLQTRRAFLATIFLSPTAGCVLAPTENSRADGRTSVPSDEVLVIPCGESRIGDGEYRAIEWNNTGQLVFKDGSSLTLSVTDS